MKITKRGRIISRKFERQILIDEYNRLLAIKKQESPDISNEKTTISLIVGDLYVFFLKRWHHEVHRLCSHCNMPRFYTYWDKEEPIKCSKAGHNKNTPCFRANIEAFLELCFKCGLIKEPQD